MKTRKLIVGVGGLKKMAEEFIDVWKCIESGKKVPHAPIEKVTFSSERLLFKVLSKSRRDLLRYVHEHGEMTIRALAKQLHRNYEEVCRDVKLLFEAGLILKDKKSTKYFVPWESIITEISLAAPEVRYYPMDHHAHAHSAHFSAG